MQNMKMNKFEQLSPEDRQRIFALCENHPYEKVVTLLAKPRPEGLALNTSVAALCRFYTVWNPLASQTRLAGQLGKTIRIRRQSTPAAVLTGVLAVLENHLLLELNRGKAILDLEKQINLMTRVHRAYISEETLNHKRGAFNSRADYFKHLEQISGDDTDHEFDFNDDPAESGKIQEVDPTTDEDLEIEKIDNFFGGQTFSTRLPLNQNTYREHIEYLRPIIKPPTLQELMNSKRQGQTTPSTPAPAPSPAGKTIGSTVPSGASPDKHPTTAASKSAPPPARSQSPASPVLTFPNPFGKLVELTPSAEIFRQNPPKSPAIPHFPPKAMKEISRNLPQTRRG
jgi:hypothetical protein